MHFGRLPDFAPRSFGKFLAEAEQQTLSLPKLEIALEAILGAVAERQIPLGLVAQFEFLATVGDFANHTAALVGTTEHLTELTGMVMTAAMMSLAVAINAELGCLLNNPIVRTDATATTVGKGHRRFLGRDRENRRDGHLRRLATRCHPQQHRRQRGFWRVLAKSRASTRNNPAHFTKRVALLLDAGQIGKHSRNRGTLLVRSVIEATFETHNHEFHNYRPRSGEQGPQTAA